MNIFSGRRSAWAITTGYVAAIYLTLSPVGSFQLWLKSMGWQGLVSKVILALSIAFILYLVVIRLRRRSMMDMLTLAAAAVMYSYIMIAFTPFPSDRIHLLEYSLLAVLFYFTFKFGMRQRFVYVLAWMATAAVGFIDEMIQSILPTRAYDLNDVMVNAMAAAVALLVVGLVMENEEGRA